MQEKIPREKFIRLGAAMGAASVLAACGGSPTGGGDGGGESEDAAPSESDSSGGESIAPESDVAPGEALDFEDSGEPAVLVHLESGDFVAYSAICTHQQCTVAYQDGELACPCHGSVFDPANGAEVIAGPAPTPLAEIPLEVRDGEVFRA
ncbi:MAG: ubiquinol-cytochrome c reductase iron-sulfur subunit [Rubrobacteraceae bacterium]